jgi:hypothetical protein
MKHENILYFTLKEFHRFSLVLELNSRAFEPARDTRKLSRIHHLHGDVPVHPRRGRLKLLCRQDSPFYHTRIDVATWSFAKRVRLGQAWLIKPLPCAVKTYSRIFYPSPLAWFLTSYSRIFALFSACTYTLSILQICFHTLKLRLMVLNCQRWNSCHRNGTRLQNFPPSHHIWNTGERSIWCCYITVDSATTAL